MITKQKNKHWQIKTKDGIYYQPAALDIIIQWILENRIGIDDLLLSQKEGNWIPLFSEPMLKGCFWHMQTEEGTVYGPVSLGEIKQLYVNKQVRSGIKLTLYNQKKYWLAIKNMPVLIQWLDDKYTPSLNYRKFLDDLLRQSALNLEIPEKESEPAEKIIEQEVKGQTQQPEETSLMHKDKEYFIQEKSKEQNRADYIELQSRYQAVTAELQGLKSGLQEKALFIEKLNKEMMEMEVTNTIRVNEIKELREQLNAGTQGASEQQLNLLQEKLLNKDKDLEQLRLEKEALDDEIQNQKQVFIDKGKELEEELKKVTDEKQGIQEFIYRLQDDLNKAISEKEQLQQDALSRNKSLEETVNELKDSESSLKAELKQKDALIKNYKETISSKTDELIGENNNLKNTIQSLQEKLSLLKQDSDKINYVKIIKNAQIYALLKNKEQIMQELLILQNSIGKLEEQLASTRNSHNLVEEQFKQQLNDIAEELNQSDKLTKGLKEQLNSTKSEYQKQIETLNSKLSNKNDEAGRFQDEIKELEETLRTQKEEAENFRNKSAQDAETAKNRYHQIELTLAEKETKLRDTIAKKEELEETFKIQKEELENKISQIEAEKSAEYKDLIQEQENLKLDFNNKLHSLEAKKEKLESALNESTKKEGQLLEDIDISNESIIEKEKIIEQVKRLSEEQEEKLAEKEKALINSHDTIKGLKDEIAGLRLQIQDRANNQKALSEEIQLINDKLKQAKNTIEEMEEEKQQMLNEQEQERKDFSDRKKQWMLDIEEMKQNWERTTEENRIIQRQFYIEKQKLTKEYTETINKQAKLEKRNKLENEIASSTGIKEELEHLYNILKDNLENLQKGTQDIQAKFQQIQVDIDNKRLSLKYLSETEKRGKKKGQFTKPEQPGLKDLPSENEIPDEPDTSITEDKN